MSQTSFDELLQCSVCLERFTNPKMLPCQHTFCLSCLKGIIKDAKTVDCPTCRRSHRVPEIGPSGFPDNLVVGSLLDMIGQSNECSDCLKKLILSECEHCQQKVCADCRASHNRLAGEITILIQSLQHGMLKKVDDGTVIETVRSSLAGALKVEADLTNAFDGAMSTLTTRKEDLMRQIRDVVKFQEAVVEGKREEILEEMRGKLLSCHSTSGLNDLKISLLRVEWVMERDKAGEMKFSGDFSQSVAGFGVVTYGEEKMGESIDRGMENSIASSSVIQGSFSLPRDAFLTGVKPEASATGRYPLNVNYKAKQGLWKLIISSPPEGCANLKPISAVYSTSEDAMYCLSEGKVLRYDAKSGVGKIACGLFKVIDMDLTDCGTLVLIDDRHVIRISADLMTSSTKDDDFTFALGNLPAGTKPTQVRCHGKEFVVLDAGKNRLLKFGGDGKFVGEIRSKILKMNEHSRMCVDKQGRVHVTSDVCVAKREDSDPEEDHHCTDPALHAMSMTAICALNVHIISWEGDIIGAHLLRVGMREYEYEFSDEVDCAVCSGCHPRYCVPNCIPSNEDMIAEFLEEHGVELITDLCVDGDEYVTFTRPGENQITVLDPKGGKYCTIGDENCDEFREPTGLSLMADGRLVVCDTGNNRIQII